MSRRLSAQRDTEHRSTRRLVGIALVLLATLTWATNMTLGRYLRGDVGPITLAAARFAVAAPILLFLLWRQPPEERRLGPERRWLVAMALTGVAAFTPVLYLGLRYTTTVNATLINGLGPLVTGLLAALLIGEPMSRRQVGGAVAGLAGITVLMSGGSPAFWHQARGNPGDLIVVLAISLWALFSVLGRRAMRRRSAVAVTCWSGLLGLPLLLLGAAWEVQHLAPNLSPQLVLMMLYIGVFPGVVGFLAWNAGVRRLGASGAMVFYNTLPLWGGLLGAVLLGESIGAAHLVGGALIIGGGLWASGIIKRADRSPAGQPSPQSNQSEGRSGR